MKMRLSIGGKILVYSTLIIVVILTLLPLAYTVSASFKPNSEIIDGSVNLIPKEPTLDNFKTVWGMSGSSIDTSVNYGTYTLNSIFVSSLTTVLSVLFSSMTAYCFGRGQFPGRKFLYRLFLGTMFISAGSITVFPLLQITTTLNMNNLIGVSILLFASGGASRLFLYMGYLKTIPRELDDASKIDGCSFFTTWLWIILPLSKPIMATIGLMAFQRSWNSYLMPKIMLVGKQKLTTLVVAVVNLQSSGGDGATQYNLMMAGTMLAIAPIVTLFLLMNKSFVNGITAGAVKG